MVAGLVMALIGSLLSILVVSFHFIRYIHNCSSWDMWLVFERKRKGVHKIHLGGGMWD